MRGAHLPVLERRRVGGSALKRTDDRAGDQRATGEDGCDANREQHRPETDPPARGLERRMRRVRGEVRSHHSQNSQHPVLTRSRPSHGTSSPAVDYRLRGFRGRLRPYATPSATGSKATPGPEAGVMPSPPWTNTFFEPTSMMYASELPPDWSGIIDTSCTVPVRRLPP